MGFGAREVEAGSKPSRSQTPHGPPALRQLTHGQHNGAVVPVVLVVLVVLVVAHDQQHGRAGVKQEHRSATSRILQGTDEIVVNAARP